MDGHACDHCDGSLTLWLLSVWCPVRSRCIAYNRHHRSFSATGNQGNHSSYEFRACVAYVG